MTYLELVNEVLRRLREDEVSSLYENQQSSLVADFVNDAKRICEDASNWSAFRGDTTIVTASGTAEYSLTGSDNRTTILDIRDTTSQAFLRKSTSFAIRKRQLGAVGNSQPSYWYSSGVDSSGDTQITLYPTPDGAYRLEVYGFTRPSNLTAEGSQLSIPHHPVVQYAWAMAAEERGGLDSVQLQSIYARAKKSLSDAIMYDVAPNDDELDAIPV